MEEEKRTETCGNCRYYAHYLGECRHELPRIVGLEVRGRWPVVDENAWCRHWDPPFDRPHE
jgi:hypothetical protein